MPATHRFDPISTPACDHGRMRSGHPDLRRSACLERIGNLEHGARGGASRVRISRFLKTPTAFPDCCRARSTGTVIPFDGGPSGRGDRAGPRAEDGSRFWALEIDPRPLDFAGCLFYGKSRRSIHCRRAATWFGRFICNSKTVVRPMAVKPTMVPDSASIRK